MRADISIDRKIKNPALYSSLYSTYKLIKDVQKKINNPLKNVLNWMKGFAFFFFVRVNPRVRLMAENES